MFLEALSAIGIVLAGSAAAAFLAKAVPSVIQSLQYFFGGVNYVYSNIPGVLPSIWACFPFAIKMFCVSLVAIAVIGGILGKLFNHV